MHWMLNKVIRGTDLIRIGANYFERNEPLFSGKGKLDVHVQGCPDIRIWRGYSITVFKNFQDFLKILTKKFFISFFNLTLTKIIRKRQNNQKSYVNQ